MDPNATWKALTEALTALHANPYDHDARNTAVRALAVLGQWIKRGGFPPNIGG